MTATTTPKLADVKEGDVLVAGQKLVTVASVTKAQIKAGGEVIRKSDGRVMNTYGTYARIATPEDIERIKAAQAQKEADREKEKQEKAERAAAMMAEAKAACGGILPIMNYTTLPDDCRLVVLSLPVKFPEHKGGYEIVVVKLKTVKARSWDKDCQETMVRAGIAFTSGHSSTDGFGITSSHSHKDDDEALWDVVCYRYHGW